MTNHITVELTEAQEAHLRAEAERHAVTPEAMMATWVQRQVDYDAWFCAEVQKGIDAADRGEFIPHEEVVARAEARRAELLAAGEAGLDVTRRRGPKSCGSSTAPKNGRQPRNFPC